MHQKPKINIHDIIDYLMKVRPYYGCMAQHIIFNIVPSINSGMSGGSVIFDEQSGVFKVILAEDRLSNEPISSQAAVVIHELMHIQHGHLFWKINQEDRNKWNVSMDLVINQSIDNLPKWALDYKKVKDKKGKPLMPSLTEEEYFNLLSDIPPDNTDDHEFLKLKNTVKPEHLKNLLKKTLESASAIPLKNSSFSKDVEDAKRTLKEISSHSSKNNYKNLIKNMIRRFVSEKIEKTWAKPSRRYGNLARGNRYKLEVSVCFYVDTSGSMSDGQVLEAISVIWDAVKTFDTKCYLALFHNTLYLSPKPVDAKNLKKIDGFMSGGTDLREVMYSIKERKDDISIIITDGHFDNVENPPKNKKMFFLITPNGCVDHPLKHIGRTLLMYD